MGTGLQRHIGCGALRRIARTGQRFDLRMGAPPGLRPTARDHAARVTIHQHTAHGRVRCGRAEVSPGKAQRHFHELNVVCRMGHGAVLFVGFVSA